jgi:hypothetical protein
MSNNVVQTMSGSNLPLPRTAGEQDLYQLIRAVATVSTVLGLGYLLLYVSNNPNFAKK